MRITSFLMAVPVMMVAFSGCMGNKNQAIEKMIPAENVEIIGPDAKLVKIVGETKIFMVPSTESNKDNSWSIQALVPIQNTLEIPGLDDIKSAKFDLLDENNSQIHHHFGMQLQNPSQAAALFGSEAGTVKKIVFEPIWKTISYYDYKTIADIVNRTENLVLNLEVREGGTTVSTTPRVYSCGFDGFVNMRKEASFSSGKIGVFRNGPEGAELLEDLGDWKKIDMGGLVGYVPSVYVQDTPTVAYNGSATADWIQGAWYDNTGSYLYIYNNGTYLHGSGSPSSYGLFIMQNNEVKFMPAWPASGGFSDTLPIDMAQTRLGNYQKRSTPGDFKTRRLNFNQVVNQLRYHTTENLLNPSSGVSSSTSGSSASAGGNSIDEMLDTYENLVNQYVKVAKKALSGDLSALDEAEKFFDKAEAYGNRLENLEDLTEAQLKRYMKITQKLVTVGL